MKGMIADLYAKMWGAVWWRVGTKWLPTVDFPLVLDTSFKSLPILHVAFCVNKCEMCGFCLPMDAWLRVQEDVHVCGCAHVLALSRAFAHIHRWKSHRMLSLCMCAYIFNLFLTIRINKTANSTDCLFGLFGWACWENPTNESQLLRGKQKRKKKRSVLQTMGLIRVYICALIKTCSFL